MSGSLIFILDTSLPRVNQFVYIEVHVGRLGGVWKHAHAALSMKRGETPFALYFMEIINVTLLSRPLKCVALISRTGSRGLHTHYAICISYSGRPPVPGGFESLTHVIKYSVFT